MTGLRRRRPFAGPRLVPLLAVALLLGSGVPASATYADGVVTIAPEDSFDLDRMRVTAPGAAASDFRVYATAEDGIGFSDYPRRWVRVMGTHRPTLAACRSARLVTYVSATRFPAGTWLCARSKGGRFARLKALDGPFVHGDPSRFRYRLWN